jgi:phenylpyruvate tautomerase PptA (4-oxalocrotonate tautomerase family)
MRRWLGAIQIEGRKFKAGLGALHLSSRSRIYPTSTNLKCRTRINPSSGGWSDQQKRALAKGLTKVVAEVGKVPVNSIHIVIREGRGLHFMFGGEHVPEFKAPASG